MKIDHVSVVLFPSPRLKLSGVHIGESSDSSIAEVRIASPLSLLGKGSYQITLASVSGADISANRLVAFPMFIGGVPEDSGVVIRKIIIEQSRVRLGERLERNR